MNISSVQPIYSITSNNSIDTITLNSTITTSATGSGYYTMGSGIGGSNGGNITITNGGGLTGSGAGVTFASGAGIGVIGQEVGSIFKWKNEEFIDCFPDFDRIKVMCEIYPGLKIAYEKFVTTYKLVKDDYDNPNIEK